MGARAVITGAMVTGLGVALVAASCGDLTGKSPFHDPDCTVTVDGSDVELSAEQAANAATIAAVAARLSMPDHAVVIAVATALQESKLHNIEYGDHDSLGLFQQRPSQGWGSAEEIMDPRFAAEQFFIHLDRVDGWQDMRVTDAAQAVQISAYPEAYERWAEDARVIGSALTGAAPAALSCTGGDAGDYTVEAIEAASAEFALDWGHEAEAVTADSGLSIDVADTDRGWRYASWLVAHAERHGVSSVRFADRVWSADEDGWRELPAEEAASDVVGVEVFGTEQVG